MHAKRTLIFATWLISASVNWPQQLIKTYEGYLDWVYWNMNFLGDLDGDGLGEVLLGEAFDTKLILLSSATGTELFSFTGSGSSDAVGVRLAALGDTDGDEVEDFGACFSKLGKCLVWSGKSKSVLLEVTLPLASITGVGDVNGDGLSDILIGKIGYILEAGSATLYMGGSFTPDYTVHGLSSLGGGFAGMAAGLGDIDGDGFDDFAVGAPADSFECVPGYVEVFSGVDGASRYQIIGETVTDNFGKIVDAMGDITGDGLSDLVVGAPTADGLPWCKVSGAGRVYFRNGADGTLLEMLEPEYPKGGFGGLLEAVGDLDGNGFSDVLARVFDGLDPNGTEVWAIDGKTRERIYTISTPPAYADTYGFGALVTATGDWNGDGFPDYLIASPNATLAGLSGAPGKLDLYSGAPIGVAAFGTPCALHSGSLPRIGATGSPVIGTHYAVHLSQVEPGLDVFLAIGGSSTSWLGVPLPLNLAVVGMPGCELLVALTKVFAAQTVEVTPGLGAATFTLRIPDQPALLGLTAFAQGFVANPPGSPTLGATTRGLALTFQ